MFLTRLRCIKLNKNYGKTVRSPIQFTTHSRSLGFLKKIDKNTEKSTTEKLKLPEDQSTDNTLKNNYNTLTPLIQNTIKHVFSIALFEKSSSHKFHIQKVSFPHEPRKHA